jgi:hypothetical protein
MSGAGAAVIVVAMRASPPVRAADFQAAWYYSLLIFVIAAMVATGVYLGQRLLGPMWRTGDRSLAVLVGTVVGVAAVFFTLILVTVVVALFPATVGGG